MGAGGHNIRNVTTPGRRDRRFDETLQLSVGDLTLDLVRHEARRDGRIIELTAKEFALLEYLMANSDRVLSRSMILSHVWDEGFQGATNIVDVYVRHLRHKIGDDDQKLLRRFDKRGMCVAHY